MAIGNQLDLQIVVNGYNQACRLVPSMLSSRVTDPDDLMHATASDPVYFINNAVFQCIYVLTTSSSSNGQFFINHFKFCFK